MSYLPKNTVFTESILVAIKGSVWRPKSHQKSLNSSRPCAAKRSVVPWTAVAFGDVNVAYRLCLRICLHKYVCFKTV